MHEFIEDFTDSDNILSKKKRSQKSKSGLLNPKKNKERKNKASQQS